MTDDDKRAWAARGIHKGILETNPDIQHLNVTAVDLPDMRGEVNVSAEGFSDIKFSFQIMTCCKEHYILSAMTSMQEAMDELKEAGYL